MRIVESQGFDQSRRKSRQGGSRVDEGLNLSGTNTTGVELPSIGREEIFEALNSYLLCNPRHLDDRR